MFNRLTSLKVLILLICGVISLHLARCMSSPAGAQKEDLGKKIDGQGLTSDEAVGPRMTSVWYANCAFPLHGP